MTLIHYNFMRNDICTTILLQFLTTLSLILIFYSYSLFSLSLSLSLYIYIYIYIVLDQLEEGK